MKFDNDLISASLDVPACIYNDAPFYPPPIFNHPCMFFIILNNELFIKIRYYVALYNILFLYILHKKLTEPTG